MVDAKRATREHQLLVVLRGENRVAQRAELDLLTGRADASKVGGDLLDRRTNGLGQHALASVAHTAPRARHRVEERFRMDDHQTEERNYGEYGQAKQDNYDEQPRHDRPR